MTAYISTDELWHDLVNSITSRHLYNETTMDDLLEGLTSAERYIIDKIVRKSKGKLVLRDVIESLVEYIKLPDSPPLATHQAPEEIVPMDEVLKKEEVTV